MTSQEWLPLSTKFFYKENRLHFQILAQMGNYTRLFGEFDNYESYRNAYDRLQLEIMERVRKTKEDNIG